MDLFLLDVLIICIVGLSCPVTCQKNDKDTKTDPVGGKSVLQMGRSFKSPLLRLLGTAILNEKTEVLNTLSKSEAGLLDKVCSLSRCDEWSKWSSCTATTKDQFGMVKRSRQCGRGLSFCPQNATQVITTESDSRVCIGEECPIGFTKTENKFCLLLQDSAMNMSEAEKFCTEKGSFVINPNTELKSKDLHGFLSKNSITGTIWLNGRREDGPKSPWVYSYESGPGDYDNWYSSEPSKGKTELCMVEENSPRRWFDRSCTDKYVFVCELV